VPGRLADVLVLEAVLHLRAHGVADVPALRVTALGDGADSDVAVGDHADQPVVVAAHRQRADVQVAHLAGGLLQ